MKKVHPCDDVSTKTIVTDQDKGSIAAIEEQVPQAAQFHGAFHCRQNIIKKCGGGKGSTPLMALWMYNLLASCNSVKQLKNIKAKYYDKMHPTNLHYLTKLPDRSQYPAARCAMGDNICMFSKSASSGVESMNKVNQLARQRTAVDVLNAVILLIKLEGECFNWYKQKAWERDNQILMELGLELMEEAFADVDIRDFWINITNKITVHTCTVSGMKSTNEYTVSIPMKDTMGSRFGSRTCGKPTKDGVPCKHMVAIVKALKIKGLSQIQIMPYWLTSAHWQAQYVADVNCRTDVLMNAVKATSNPEDDLCYCPAWTAGNKKGQPKKNTHQKSVADLIEESSSKKRKQRRKMFCNICQKFNHTTENCFKNPANQLQTISKAMESEAEEGGCGLGNARRRGVIFLC